MYIPSPTKNNPGSIPDKIQNTPFSLPGPPEKYSEISFIRRLVFAEADVAVQSENRFINLRDGEQYPVLLP
jgi:hypothetical protein